MSFRYESGYAETHSEYSSQLITQAWMWSNKNTPDSGPLSSRPFHQQTSNAFLKMSIQGRNLHFHWKIANNIPTHCSPFQLWTDSYSQTWKIANGKRLAIKCARLILSSDSDRVSQEAGTCKSAHVSLTSYWLWLLKSIFFISWCISAKDFPRGIWINYLSSKLFPFQLVVAGRFNRI